MIYDMVKDAVIESIRIGLTNKDACEVNGIEESTFYRWMDEKEEFRKSVKEAQLAAKQLHLKNIHRAAAEDRQWTASAWFLERKFPDEFKNRREITGADGGPLQLEGKLNEQDADMVKRSIEYARASIASFATSEPAEQLGTVEGTDNQGQGI